MLSSIHLRRYRELRSGGPPASDAHRAVTDAARYSQDLPHHPGPNGSLVFEPADPGLADYTITATAELDDCPPELDWLGEFTDTWSEDALENSRDPRHYRYFVPAYTVAQRRKDLSTRGYARGPAQLLAEHQAHQDMRLGRTILPCVIVVSVRKADVLLGTAVLGTDIDPDADCDETIVAVITYNDLIGEAVREARAVLPDLIAALAA